MDEAGCCPRFDIFRHIIIAADADDGCVGWKLTTSERRKNPVINGVHEYDNEVFTAQVVIGRFQQAAILVASFKRWRQRTLRERSNIRRDLGCREIVRRSGFAHTGGASLRGTSILLCDVTCDRFLDRLALR